MNNLFLIIRREYLQRVRTKGFIISTLLMPLLFAALVIIPIALTRLQTGEQKRIGVIDQSGLIYEDLSQSLNEKSENGRPKFLLTKFSAEGDIAALRSQLKAKIINNQLDAYLFIGRDVTQKGAVDYHSKNVSNFMELRALESTISAIIINRRLSQVGLDPVKVKSLVRRIDLKTIRISKQGETEDKGQTFAISYALVMILYGSLIFYGVSIMRSVIEEKSSRIVEILISSVRPFELMLGKLIGVGAVGLTQILIWSLFLTLLSLYGVAMISVFATQSIPKIEIPPSLLVYFVVYYISGYFLFGSLYAAIGAMVNSEQEAQQAQAPILSFLIIPLVLMTFIIRAPNSTFSTVLSLVPFFTPLLMFMRICIEPPPLFQILGSILLLLSTTVLIMWLVSKIYRVGILMYGKKPTLPELIKWLKYT
ncbi:MAG: ABC transporter permease [Acidobacteria bacterium]|nr:ABC transporter permease [Acidobacteriota bacterium]MBI3657270.1 ABC transporter permease [Acidobacteriota bacterium]